MGGMFSRLSVARIDFTTAGRAIPGGSGPCAGRSSKVKAICSGAFASVVVCADETPRPRANHPEAKKSPARRAAPRNDVTMSVGRMTGSLFVVADGHAGRSLYRLGRNELLGIALELLNALDHGRTMNGLCCVLRRRRGRPLLQQVANVRPCNRARLRSGLLVHGQGQH